MLVDDHPEVPEVPGPAEQKRLVNARTLAVGSTLVEHDIWHVVSLRWWEAWRSYVGFDEPADVLDASWVRVDSEAMDVDAGTSRGGATRSSGPPGEIDNSALLGDAATGQLRRGVQEYTDFVLLQTSVYQVLAKWYGGGLALPRKVVSVGAGGGRELRIELFPLRLLVCRTDDEGRPDKAESKSFLFSRSGLVPDLVEAALTEFGEYVGLWSESKARVWHYRGADEQEGDAFKYEGWMLLHSTSKPLEDFGVVDGGQLMLEIGREVKEKGYSFYKKVEFPFFHRCRLEHKRRMFKDPAAPGTVLDVDDPIDAGVSDGSTVMTWYPATIVEGKTDRVLVHFQNREKPKMKLPPLLTEGGWMADRQLTPEAKAGIQAVFKRYASGDKIDKSGLRGLLSCATNMLVQEGSAQISNLLREYGLPDQSGVSSEGFLKYWHSRAVGKNIFLQDELTRLFERVGATAIGQSEEDKLLAQGKEWIERTSDRLGLFRSHEYASIRDKSGFRDFRRWDNLDAKLDGVWKQAEVLEVNWDEMAVLTVEKSTSSSSSRKDGEWIAMESARLAEFESKSLEQDDDVAPLLTRTNSGGGVCERAGACGLQNLGNTCFMNATLQCLSNCGPLRVYFAGSPQKVPGYHSSLSSSPLSMNGRLAREFGRLLAQMWSNTQTSTAPRELKSLIGQQRPEFSGYQQQDAQELLTFMLDGLHEDVNRAPYPRPTLPDVEANGRPDAEVAKEGWDQHLQRNDSRIVDLFQFQIRSEVTCPVCDNVSVTFDPIMYLTLPVPKPPHSISVTVVPWSWPETAMRRIDVFIDKGATFEELTGRVVKQLGLQPDGSTELVFAEIWSDRIDRIFEPSASTSTLPSVHAYEVRIPEAALKQNAVRDFVPVTFKRKATGFYSNGDEHCAPPRLMCIAKDASTNTEVANQMLAFASAVAACASASEADKATQPMNDVTNANESSASASASDVAMADAVSPQASMTPASPPANDAPEAFELLRLPDSWSKGDPLPKDDATFVWDTFRHSSFRSVCVFFADEAMAAPLPNCLPVAEESAERAAGVTTTVHSCLLKNAEREQLAEEDSVYCRKCKEHRRCWKKIELWSRPSELIIHLKRFGRDRIDGPLTKIETPVEFPMQLDMRPYLAQQDGGDAMYELYGVVNHHGGLGGGHYTAHARVTSASDDGSEPRPEGEWFNFNDSHASKASVKDIDQAAGYILFYRRCSGAS